MPLLTASVGRSQSFSPAGSVPHFAALENWVTTFTLVNKGSEPARAYLTTFGDSSLSRAGPPGPVKLPLTFPQQPPAAGPILADSVDQAFAGNASFIVETAPGFRDSPVMVGWAQLAATGAVDGFATLHSLPDAQEAVVPLETRNASSYVLAFDNTGGVVMGVAVANLFWPPPPGINRENIGVVIRDESGIQLQTGTILVSPGDHRSFVLSTQYPVTANRRGTIEFDTPAGGQISVVGIRFSPPNNALSAIPALANVGTNGGSIAHMASGTGWKTTFVLVNTGATAAQVHLKFFGEDGAPLVLTVSLPQTGAGIVASSVNQTVAAGATLVVENFATITDIEPMIGSAQLTTDGNVGGFAIYRYNPYGQEAVIPLESRNASAYVLAFDNRDGTSTGIAINSIASRTVSIPVVIRDDTGAQIGADTLSLAPNGHLSFTLAADKYPVTANIRGTIEFISPPGGQLGVVGFRMPATHTFTTLPALAK